MRALLREQRLEDAVEVDSAGTATGTRASRPTSARPRPRAPAASRSRAPRATVAPADFDDYDLILAADRRNLRDLAALRRDGARAKLHLLREFDPGSEGAPDLDVPDPYYGGDDGFEHVLDLVEAACRGPAGLAARRRPAVIAEAVARALGRPLAAAPPGRRRRHQRRLAGRARGRGARVREDARGARPGEYATEAAGLRWLGEARTGSVPEVLAVARDAARPRSSRSSWIDEGRLDAARRGAARARARAPARRRRAGVRRAAARRAASAGCGSARSSCRAATAADWPAFYAEHRLAPLLARPPGAARCPPAARAIEAVIERLPELAGPPEPPARLHGDLWGGNVLAGGRRAAVADRPGGARRPPRDRPRDAGAVRRARAAHARRLRRGRTRSPTGTRSASRCGSCSRCSSTPCCSAAATARRRCGPRAGAAP